MKDIRIEISLWGIYLSEIKLSMETALCINVFIAAFS